MKAKIKLEGKEVIIEDIEQARGMRRFSGLMFRAESKALLFEFDKPGFYSIHSWFCKPFLAVWLNQGRVVDYKMVAPNQVVKPKQEFDKLIEIPFNDRYKKIFDFLDEKGKV